jgi:mono/diheme cytochrome c family protein
MVVLLLVGALTVAARFADDGAKKKGPVISTDEELFPFGTIHQGDVKDHVFTIRNIGDDTLKISNTQSSCGCTTSMLDNNTIPPGGVGSLKATFNSSGKMGHVSKTIYIYSNDVTNPNKTVQITADIMTEPASIHGGSMVGAVHLEGIFEGDCATCHVDKGRGLKGKDLFEADCAVCHGAPADGKPGPDIHSPAIAKHPRSEIVALMSNGIPNSMMPAFTKAHSGPLTDEEIASVADYIISVTGQK